MTDIVDRLTARAERMSRFDPDRTDLLAAAAEITRLRDVVDSLRRSLEAMKGNT